MPKPRVDHIYVADGLAEDCEELMLKCSQVSKLSYEKFCDIWKELDFSCIFHGRQTGAELAEFSEEALHVAKHFMVSNIEDYEKSVAGLFLVYAILNLQPYSKFAALRLVQEDVPAIQQLELVARRERRIDILYILGEVLIKGPCEYHVSARERGLDFCLRKYFDGYIQHAFVGQKPRGVFHRHNEEINLMREISVMEERYHKTKQKLSVEKDPSLQYVNCNYALELQASLKGVASGVIDPMKELIFTPVKKTTETEHVSLIDHHDNVQSIKLKALKNVVNPMRHLTGVQQRASEPVPSTSKNKTPPKSTKDSQRSQSDTPEQIKSPTRFPWSIKPLFNESDDEPNRTSVENTSTQDMVLIESDDENDEQNYTESKTKNRKRSKKDNQNNKESKKDNQDAKEFKKISHNNTESNISNINQKRSPRKNATPRKLTKLDLDETKNSELDMNQPKHDIKNTEDDSDQFINISIDRIPKEISVNNNIEFEIIDEFNSSNNQSTVKPSTTKNKVTSKDKAPLKEKVTSKEKASNKKRASGKDNASIEENASNNKTALGKDKASSEEKASNNKRLSSAQKVKSKEKVTNEEKTSNKKRAANKDKTSNEEKATNNKGASGKEKASSEEKVCSKKRAANKDKTSNEEKATNNKGASGKEKASSEEKVCSKKRAANKDKTSNEQKEKNEAKATNKKGESGKEKASSEEKVCSKKRAANKDKTSNEQKEKNEAKATNKKGESGKEKASSEEKACSKKRAANKYKTSNEQKEKNEEKATNNKGESGKEKASTEEKASSKKRAANKDKTSNEQEVTSEKIVPRKKKKLNHRVGNSRLKRLGMAQFADDESDSD